MRQTEREQCSLLFEDRPPPSGDKDGLKRIVAEKGGIKTKRGIKNIIVLIFFSTVS
jgi:hypothetical protein